MARVYPYKYFGMNFRSITSIKLFINLATSRICPMVSVKFSIKLYLIYYLVRNRKYPHNLPIKQCLKKTT